MHQNQIAAELSALLATARVTHTRPDWLTSSEHAIAWLMITDEIVAPLVLRGEELVASTVVHKNMTEGARRANRNQAAARRRAGRKGARTARGHEPGRPRSGPSEDEWR